MTCRNLSLALWVLSASSRAPCFGSIHCRETRDLFPLRRPMPRKRSGSRSLCRIRSSRTRFFNRTFPMTLHLEGKVGALRGALQALRGELESQQGSLVALHRPEKMPSFDAWGNAGDALPLMKAVKQQLDPKSTLNPGRFVDGI